MPHLFGHRREYVVPDRRERASELLHSGGACHEPDVAVLTAFAPTSHMHVAYTRDREHRALNLQKKRPQLRCAVVVEIGEIDVFARLEQDDDGETARFVERANCPVLIRPEIIVVSARATPAVDTAGAISRPLGIDGRRELAHAELSVEGP